LHEIKAWTLIPTLAEQEQAVPQRFRLRSQSQRANYVATAFSCFRKSNQRRLNIFLFQFLLLSLFTSPGVDCDRRTAAEPEPDACNSKRTPSRAAQQLAFPRTPREIPVQLDVKRSKNQKRNKRYALSSVLSRGDVFVPIKFSNLFFTFARNAARKQPALSHISCDITEQMLPGMTKQCSSAPKAAPFDAFVHASVRLLVLRTD
jgi:hypothetical protein